MKSGDSKPLLSMPRYNVKANRAYHDRIAAKYENDPRVRLGTMHPNCARRLRWLNERYNIKKFGLRALNIGVGTGNLMRQSGEIFGCTIGLDISENMLRHAKRYTNLLIQGNAVEMPLRTETIDLVFCVAVLHHIYDLENFFKSVYRVLKPGGIFYSDYDPNRRFRTTIEKSVLLNALLSLYKKVSDIFIFSKQDESTLRDMHDMAEYHEEFSKGLEPTEVTEIMKKVGYSEVKCIWHSDAPNLDRPRDGRFIHKLSELMLYPISRDYSDRAKIFSIIAVK